MGTVCSEFSRACTFTALNQEKEEACTLALLRMMTALRANTLLFPVDYDHPKNLPVSAFVFAVAFNRLIA